MLRMLGPLIVEKVIVFFGSCGCERVTEMSRDGPETISTESGTEGSNPAPSSRQSVSAVNSRPLPEEPRGPCQG